LSNSGPAVRLYCEGWATGLLEDRYKRRIIPRYLVAIHHPEDYDPFKEDEAMSSDIHALNKEMVAAGVRSFVGGLLPASSARSLRAEADGMVVITDGPYLETKEHIGAFRSYKLPIFAMTGPL